MARFRFACFIGAFIAALPAASPRAEDGGQRGLDGLAATAGAWYINGKCGFLDMGARRSLEWHAIALNEALAARRVAPERIAEAARAAEAMAGKPEHAACTAASRKLVDAAVAEAPMLLKEIANRSYDPKTSYRDYALARMAKITAAIRLAERCNYMPKNLAEDVKRVQTRVLTGMVDSYGAGAIYDALNRGVFDAGGDHHPCGAAAERIYLQALADLRALEAEFAAK